MTVKRGKHMILLTRSRKTEPRNEPTEKLFGNRLRGTELSERPGGKTRCKRGSVLRLQQQHLQVPWWEAMNSRVEVIGMYNIFVDCASGSTTGFSNRQKEYEEKSTTPEFKGTVFFNTYVWELAIKFLVIQTNNYNKKMPKMVKSSAKNNNIKWQ